MQMFRLQRPSVESVLEGRSAEFRGMLGYDQDGVGVWSGRMEGDSRLTVVTSPQDMVIAEFFKLLKGEYGSAPRDGVVVVVNPGWTDSSNIGNFWERQLKQDAKDLLDNGGWTPLYHLEVVRRADFGGLLLFCFPYPNWLVYDSNLDLVLESSKRPRLPVIEQALRDAREGLIPA